MIRLSYLLLAISVLMMSASSCKKAESPIAADDLEENQDDSEQAPEIRPWKGWAERIGIQSSGKIVFRGYMGQAGYGEKSEWGVYRLTDESTIDTTFDASHLKAARATQTYSGVMLVQPDNKILIKDDFDINGQEKGLIRLMPDGQLDEAFLNNMPIKGRALPIRSIHLASSGDIFVLMWNTYEGMLKLSPDGVLVDAYRNVENAAFGDSGEVFLHMNSHSYLSPIDFSNIKVQEIKKLKADGSVDNSFRFFTEADSIPTIYGISLLNDGGVLANTVDNSVLKIDHTGKLDTTFISSKYIFKTERYSHINADRPFFGSSHIQRDGKIILVGVFDGIKDRESGRTVYDYKGMVRLNQDGSIDESFYKSSLETWVSNFTLLPDDSFYYTISKDAGYNYPRTMLRWIDKAGGVKLEKGFAGYIYDLKVLSDNDVLLGGSFLSYYDYYDGLLLMLDSHAADNHPAQRVVIQ